MRKIFLASIFATLLAQAEVPSGYYSSLTGKSGEQLRAAVKEICASDDYTIVKYGDKTWNAFLTTDTRTIEGREIWWDMYSNEMVSTDNHTGLNIEHSVANSWFGGQSSTQPYSDLFHLNPSNEAANNQKGSLPLGEVMTVAWENGLVKTGQPKSGTAGTAAKVFEPADEYKGDFARAYLYIFTLYDNYTWKTDQAMYNFSSTATLEQWAAEMLCRWAKEDPVDSKEISRNEEIYKIQKNRNPFIDHPELIDYIWGDKKGTAYTASSAARAIDRPAEPKYIGKYLSGVNTYTSRWWEKERVSIEHPEGELWVSINGGAYQQFGPGVDIAQASSHGETLKMAAYTLSDAGEYSLKSSTAYLTLTARDPNAQDYTEAQYTPVSSFDYFHPESDCFVVYSSSNNSVMGHIGGTSSSSFLPSTGQPRKYESDLQILPSEAAIVRFHSTGTGKYTLEVIDALNNTSKGYWNEGKSNKATLKTNTGTAASVAFNDDGTAKIEFEGGSSLQYNKTQPRFSNYTSNQTPVRLARFSSFLSIPSSAIERAWEDEGCVAIDGNSILLPPGWLLFDLNGRRSEGVNLEPGIYIARSAHGKAVKIFIGK